MKVVKLMACAALAVVCAAGFTGCSKKDASSDEPAKVEVSKLDASRPRVADGFVVAAMVRAPEETSLAPRCKQHGLTVSDLIKVVPRPARQMIGMFGLDKVGYKWLSVSVGGTIEKDKVPDFALALASDLDLDKTIAECEKLLAEESDPSKPEFKKTTIAGVSAYEIVAKNTPVTLAVASLGGKLIVIGSSAAILEKQLYLYCGGKGEKSEFASFGKDGNAIVGVQAVKVGETIKKALPDQIKAINAVLPGGDKIVENLGSVGIALGASEDGKDVKLTLSVETGTDVDAEYLVKEAEKGLKSLIASAREEARRNDDVKMVLDILRTVKIEAKGKDVTLVAFIPAEPVLQYLAAKKNDLLK